MEGTKKCTKCSQELPLDRFYKIKHKSGKEGYDSWCKCCRIADSARRRKDNPEKAKAQRARWRKNNLERERAQSAKWRKNNPEKARSANAAWRRDNPEKHRANYVRWRKCNLGKARLGRTRYVKGRRAVDIDFRIKLNITSAMYRALNGNDKSDHTIELLGCSIEYLRHYLEDQFVEGMTWDNYGRNGWHIDHIIPLSYFDFTDPEQQKRAWHYTNLRPLWAIDNMQKGNKIEERQLILL